MCVKPITLRRRLGNRTITEVLPCGKCAECLKKRQNGYMCRCIEEARKRGNIWFITLTYANDHLPIVKGVPSLCREDIKKWKREVRRDYQRKTGNKFPDFSYLLCGEYGSRTHRPHYHGFLCGLDKYHAMVLSQYWQDHYGFTVFKFIPFSSKDVSCVSRYVAKYCVKPDGLRMFSDQVEKPRIVTSVGFGLPEDFESRKAYYLDGVNPHSLQGFTRGSLDTIQSRLKYTFDGVSYQLPLYLRKKLLYEKSFNGNLKASSLSYLLKMSVQHNIVEDFDRELRRLEGCKSEREITEALAKYCDGKANSLQSRQYVAEQDLLSSYKKDKF